MVALDRALADLRGRAEIHALHGELDLAHADLDALRELRGFVPNAIHDAEDLRVVAMVRAAEGDLTARRGYGPNRPALRVKTALCHRDAYRVPKRKSRSISGLGRAPVLEWFLLFGPMKARLQHPPPTRSMA